MNWIMHNKLIFIVAVLVLAGGVWYGLSQGSSAPPLLVTTNADGTTAAGEQGSDQEVIGTLLALRAVTLSGSIFTNPAFLSLQDFGTPIVSEPIGRPNPFAPLGSQSANPSAQQNANPASQPSGR